MNQMAIRVIVGIALLVVATLTFTSFRETDRWRRPGHTTTRREDDPYAGLARLLAAPAQGSPAGVRDPFRAVSTPASPTKAPPKVVVPVEPQRELPVLTAIVSDAEPQAVIRYQGKNFTVGAGGLFADYQVISITPDAVILQRAGEQLILKRPKKGD